MKQLNTSLFFLWVLMGSILLSMYNLLLQRQQLLSGGEVPPWSPRVRITAAALSIGALGYFLAITLEAWEREDIWEDPAALRSLRRNTLAAILVLWAALVRLADLVETTAAVQEVLPVEEDLPA